MSASYESCSAPRCSPPCWSRPSGSGRTSRTPSPRSALGDPRLPRSDASRPCCKCHDLEMLPPRVRGLRDHAIGDEDLPRRPAREVHPRKRVGVRRPDGARESAGVQRVQSLTAGVLAVGINILTGGALGLAVQPFVGDSRPFAPSQAWSESRCARSHSRPQSSDVSPTSRSASLDTEVDCARRAGPASGRHRSALRAGCSTASR